MSNFANIQMKITSEASSSTDLIRLSDTTPSLIQLCASCQKAVRECRITRLRVPAERGAIASSCALCVLITGYKTEREKTAIENTSFWKQLVWQVLHHKLRVGAAERWHSRHGEVWDTTPMIGDMTDLIFLSTEASFCFPKFEFPSFPRVDVINSAHLLAQPVVRVVPARKIDTLMVQQWLSHCDMYHHRCQRMDTKVDFGIRENIMLIDVQNKKLVQRSSGCNYLALSYVWGRTKQLMLNEYNIDKLTGYMALQHCWNEIPQVVQDAICFTAAIGEHYLWVDTMCVAQGSKNKHLEIARMDEVYNGAFCTLVALDCKDATSNLPGFRPGTRNIRPIARLHDLLIAQRQPELAATFSSSTYESRAWTFQERLLSTRCLYFTSEQLYFHCQTELWSEDRYEHFQQNADLFGNYSSLNWLSTSEQRNTRDKFMIYSNLVVQYTKRELSRNSDIVDAFLGVTNALGKGWKWTFVQGLPVQSLHLALLWDFSNLDQTRIRSSHNGLLFPSWSWAGWTGGKHYALAQQPLASPDNSGVRKDEQQLIHEDGTAIQKWSPDNLKETVASRMSFYADLSLHGSLSDVLSFWAEELPCRRFNYLRTRTTKHGRINGRSDCKLMRVLNHGNGACGVLFHSGASPPGFPKNWNFQFTATRFKLIRLTLPVEPLTSSLDDAYVEVDKFSGDENVFDEKYREPHFAYTVMLIEWKKEGYAERVAMGQVSPIAWEDAEPKKSRILLR